MSDYTNIGAMEVKTMMQLVERTYEALYCTFASFVFHAITSRKYALRYKKSHAVHIHCL